MKRCPDCQIVYPDSINYCFKDGSRLVPKEAPQDSASPPVQQPLLEWSRSRPPEEFVSPVASTRKLSPDELPADVLVAAGLSGATGVRAPANPFQSSEARQPANTFASSETGPPAPLFDPLAQHTAACQKCGASLSPSDLFCGSCGAGVSAQPNGCPFCGMTHAPGQRYCSITGRPMNRPAPHPGRYTIVALTVLMALGGIAIAAHFADQHPAHIYRQPLPLPAAPTRPLPRSTPAPAPAFPVVSFTDGRPHASSVLWPHRVSRAFDGDPTTDWVALSDRHQTIRVNYRTDRTITAIGLQPPGARTSALHIKDLNVRFSDGSLEQLHFADQPGMQIQTLPAPVTSNTVRLEPLTFYPSASHRLAIAEIVVQGYEKPAAAR